MRNKWRLIIIALVLVSRLCWSTTGSAEVVDRVVAIVNGDVITLSDLDQAMTSHLTQILRQPNRDAAFYSARRQMIEQLVNDRLLHQAMKRAKVEVEQGELDRALEGFLQERKMTHQQLQAALQQQHIPAATFLKRLEDEVRQMKFIQQEVGRRVRISEQEMEDYYRRNMKQFKVGGRVRVAQIVLGFTPGMTTKDREALHRKAIDLARQARQSDFAAIAKEYSDGPKAEEGGDLGVVDPTTLHPQIARTLAHMQVGEVSSPIVSKVGYHIIKLVDRGSTSEADYVRLKDPIQQALYQQKMAAAVEQYVNQLRQRAYIEIKVE